MATPGRDFSPSAARSLSLHEAEELKATALGLPDSWCVQLLPPHGQLAISPLLGRVRSPRIWTASAEWGFIAHERHYAGI